MDETQKLKNEITELKAKSFDLIEEVNLYKANYEGLINKVCEIFQFKPEEISNIQVFIEKLEQLAIKVAEENSVKE